MDSLQKRIEEHTSATAQLCAEIEDQIQQHRKAITQLETQRKRLIDQTQNALHANVAEAAQP